MFNGLLEKQQEFTKKYKVVKCMRKMWLAVVLLVVGAAVIYKKCIYGYYKAAIN